MIPGSKHSCCVVYDTKTEQWLYFHSAVKILASKEQASVVDTLKEVERLVERDKLYTVGFVSYEASPAFDSSLRVRSSGTMPLIWFGLYESPEHIYLPLPAGSQQFRAQWFTAMKQEQYRSAINKIKEYIRDGDSYQVNYTYRLQAKCRQDPWQYFLNMIHAQGCGYGAFINTECWAICSASPELFFKKQNRELISCPMKGTVSRGLTYQEDLDKRQWLENSKKNKAENLIIVDMVRNDIGHVAETGSVETKELFRIEKYPTLWQMISTISCQTSANISDIFKALFPAASITGAPKTRAMQLIAELEDTARGIYTGSIGFIKPDKSSQFNVTIRSAVIDKTSQKAEYGIGGGIVWDSVQNEELNESRLKARILAYNTLPFELLETILCVPGEGYYLLDSHLQRLTKSADYFSFDIDIEQIKKKLTASVTGLPNYPHKIRLLASKKGDISIEVNRINKHTGPYKLKLAKTPVSSQEDYFLYHKTTNRQIYERAQAESLGADDILLWNENYEVTESSIANIVVEIDGQLLTPPVSCGLLAGVYRNYLLEQGKIKEERVRKDDLPRCSKIYLINSLRKMWQVSLVEKSPPD